jgi:8-oxo-dGTP diphosphatase
MKAGKDFIGVGGGTLIVNDQNETLLIKRGNKSKNESGYWSQPGGSVEYGETVKAALLREIKEELGVDIELLAFLGYTDHTIKEENQHWVAFNYAAKIVSGEPKNMEPHKIDDFKWFKFDSLPENLNQTTKESIVAYKNLKQKATTL